MSHVENITIVYPCGGLVLQVDLLTLVLGPSKMWRARKRPSGTQTSRRLWLYFGLNGSLAYQIKSIFVSHFFLNAHSNNSECTLKKFYKFHRSQLWSFHESCSANSAIVSWRTSLTYYQKWQQSQLGNWTTMFTLFWYIWQINFT